MRHYRSVLLALAVLALAVFAVSGCSSQDRNASTQPAEVKTAPVTFVFDVQNDLPDSVVKYGLFYYSDADCQNQIGNPEFVEREDPQEGSQEVTLDVPVEAVKIKICYYDTHDKIVLESTTETLDLSSGEAQTITIKDTAPPQGANVILTFDETVVVPKTSTTCQVNMFDGDGNKAISSTTAVDPQALQDITVAGVPTNVTIIELLWLDESEAAHGSHHLTEIPELVIGETTIVTVSGQADMDTSDLTLTIQNAWNEKNLTAADVHIAYKSECISAGEATVAGTLDGNTCTAKLTDLLGKNVEVLSVTLSNQTTNVPFEWLNYATAQPVSEEKLTLDVDDNEFAGGSGTAEDPYLLANPRQFYHIDDHLDASYQQIADIDFAGSCGITLKEDGSVDKSDDTARYYNDGQGYKAVAPYLNTGATPFTGTYDGAYEDNSYAIRNMVVYFNDAEKNGIGLFGRGEDCTFKNVTIDETCCLSCIGRSCQMGSLICGMSSPNSACYVENCASKARLICSESGGAGGLVYFLQNDEGYGCTVHFKDCSFEGSVQGGFFAIGGFCGSSTLYPGSSFENCVNNGTVSSGYSVGVFFGFLDFQGSGDPVTFTNCANHGAITASSQNCGGIIGETTHSSAFTSSLKFDGCENTGALKAEGVLGGLVGNAGSEDVFKKLSINNCKCSSGTLAVTNDSVGGLIGRLNTGEFELSGSNEASCTFEISDTVTNVGGIFGDAASYYSKEAELQGILKDKVTVSETCQSSILVNSANNRGTFCGNPWINTL